MNRSLSRKSRNLTRKSASFMNRTAYDENGTYENVRHMVNEG